MARKITIEMCLTHNERKSFVAERFIRTLTKFIMRLMQNQAHIFC